jgi:hypothetical protein
MKRQGDHHHLERVFQKGDQVFLKLQPYKQTSHKAQEYHKLEPKFYGPYQIIKCIGSVAYKVSLPTSFKIHLVFHVSFLKKVVRQNCRVQTILPEVDEHQLHGRTSGSKPSFLNSYEHQLHGRTIKE